jgi:hypothetical protein
MKRFSALFLIFLLTFSSIAIGEDGPLPPVPPGPLLLTSVREEMLSPDYWINKLPEPDKPIKTAEELKVFNEDIHAMIKDCVDVFRLGASKSGSSIKKFIEYQYKAVRGRGLYDLQNNVVPPAYFDKNIKDNLNLEAIPSSIKIKYGVASHPVRVRSLPTEIKLMEKKDDPEFDVLQYTRLKVWDPVAIYHTSKDGKWVFLQSAYIRGWAEASGIVVSNTETLKKKLSKILVVTGESVIIYKDPGLTERRVRASMGTRLALDEKRDGLYVIPMPARGKNGQAIFVKGYISAKADVSPHYLPFTQRNIITQAFKLLGARYGWAGMYYGRDCSGFIQDVFLPFGIDMPRGSEGQTYVGTQLGHFEYKGDMETRAQTLQNATPGITLLRMPHHQMIYLGQENNQFYVIHCTWAERYSMTSDDKNRINQVVVSDLNLNGQSYIGSLFDRVIAVTELN